MMTCHLPTTRPAITFLAISCDPRSVLSSLSGQKICLGTCQAWFRLAGLWHFWCVAGAPAEPLRLRLQKHGTPCGQHVHPLTPQALLHAHRRLLERLADSPPCALALFQSFVILHVARKRRIHASSVLQKVASCRAPQTSEAPELKPWSSHLCASTAEL